MSNESQPPIGNASKITIALMVTILGAAIGFTAWGTRVADDVSSIKTNLTEIVKDHEERIRKLERKAP